MYSVLGRNRVCKRGQLKLFNVGSGQSTEVGRVVLRHRLASHDLPDAGQKVHEQILGSLQKSNTN